MRAEIKNNIFHPSFRLHQINHRTEMSPSIHLTTCPINKEEINDSRPLFRPLFSSPKIRRILESPGEAGTGQHIIGPVSQAGSDPCIKLKIVRQKIEHSCL